MKSRRKIESVSVQNTNSEPVQAAISSESTFTKTFSVFSRNIFYLVVSAFLLRLWFNFGYEHPDYATVADASEYLRYTKALSNLNFLAPSFGPEWKEFAITGPAFPFFLMLVAKISLTSVDSAHTGLFIVAQSLISAITVALISYATRQLWNERTAYYAAIMAALYPGFIVNSGRLYSETFATFLECGAMVLVLLWALKAKRKATTLLALGATLVLLQLTRSSMILFSFCLTLFIFQLSWAGQKTNLKLALSSALTLSLGMALVLAPWFLLQKSAFDKISPIVDRVGAYNLFIGTNTAIQGFLTYPYPDGRDVEKKSLPRLLLEAVKKSPSGFFKLALDKPARLFKFPWNDFRAEIGPISFQTQVIIHQLLILFAVFGLCLSLFSSSGGTDEQKKVTLRFLPILTILLNLLYLAFITVPRYNLVAMPAIIMLAAAGLNTILTLLKEQRQANAPKIALVTAIVLLVYLRDDIRSTNLFATVESATYYIVQGSNSLIRGITSGALAITISTALFYCVNLLNNGKLAARIVIIAIAALTLPLCLFPQRANGRIGEGILTLARPQEKLCGTITLPAIQLKSENCQWFLLIDSDQGQLLKNQMTISINGRRLSTPAIAGLTALDDWTNIKKGKENSYLECSYIFDCLSRPAGISNSELRQWFAFPVSPVDLSGKEQDDQVRVEIEQISNIPSTLFCATPVNLNKKSRLAERIMPARSLYSWEKAFYGVENDAGFTDTRLDEKIRERASNWTLSYQGKSEAIAGIDANIRLIKVQCQPLPQAIAPSTVEAFGQGEVRLKIPTGLLESKHQLLTIKVDSKARAKSDYLPESQSATAEFCLNWLNEDGQVQRMLLPALPAVSPGHGSRALSFVADLSQIRGSDIELACRLPSKSFQIELRASALPCHPFFSPQELF